MEQHNSLSGHASNPSVAASINSMTAGATSARPRPPMTLETMRSTSIGEAAARDLQIQLRETWQGRKASQRHLVDLPEHWTIDFCHERGISIEARTVDGQRIASAKIDEEARSFSLDGLHWVKSKRVTRHESGPWRMALYREVVEALIHLMQGKGQG